MVEPDVSSWPPARPPIDELIGLQRACERFYRELASAVGEPVLELACDSGRLTIQLASDKHEVVGLEASPSKLRIARATAEAAGLDVLFVEADMRKFELGRRFALVIISSNSLTRLTNNDELKSCLRSVVRHLAPGGLLAFDVANPDIRELARCNTESVRFHLGMNSTPPLAAEEMAVYDPVQQVRLVQWRITDPSSRGRELLPLRLRVLFPQEVSLLLDAAGLELAARYGDFERGPLTSGSSNQVCLARASLSSIG